MSTLKSHKLLARPCPAAPRPEDCAPLKSHKLLTRSCSGDPRCEPGGKPQRLLGRSYPSGLRVEELYSLKAHRLLGKAPAGAPKASRTESGPEPSEGRRLSLTSGLMGILTPSSSQPAVRNSHL